MFKKIHEMFSGIINKKSKEGFSNSGIKYLFIFLVVFGIISVILDILRFTPVYENSVMKNIIDANYWLSYGIGSLGKLGSGIFICISIISIYVEDRDKGFTMLYLGIIVPLILFTSFIFDIIQFTPLMQNNYVNQFAVLNTHTTIMSMMIAKLMFPLSLL